MLVHSNPKDFTLNYLLNRIACNYHAWHKDRFHALGKLKTRIRQRDALILVGKKIRREQVGTVPTFSVRLNGLKM